MVQSKYVQVLGHRERLQTTKFQAKAFTSVAWGRSADSFILTTTVYQCIHASTLQSAWRQFSWELFFRNLSGVCSSRRPSDGPTTASQCLMCLDVPSAIVEPSSVTWWSPRFAEPRPSRFLARQEVVKSSPCAAFWNAAAVQRALKQEGITNARTSLVQAPRLDLNSLLLEFID